jgi:hypothetical protein
MKNRILTATAFTFTIGINVFGQIHDLSSGFSSVEYNAPSCHNGSNGWISVTPEPDWASFEIVWSTGAIGPVIQELTSGTYIYSITNTYGDVVTDTIELMNPAAFEIEADIIQPTSSDQQNGQILISTIMGNDYDYSWTTENGTGINTISLDQLTLGAGTYKLYLENSSECIAVREFTLVPTVPYIDPVLVDLSQTINYGGSQDKEILVGSSPLKGMAHIKPGSSTQKITIYRQDGMVVENHTPLSMTDNLQQLELAPGFYVAVFTLENGSTISKNFRVE